MASISGTEVEGVSKNDNNKETEIAETSKTSETNQGTSDSNYVNNGEERKIEDKEKIEKVKINFLL